MKKFWNSKKFWLILALIIIGVFIYLFLFPQTEIPQEIKEKGGTVSAAGLPISSIYRYDFKEQNYIFDEGNSWQNSDFSRYVYDLAPASSTLEKCYYFLYDNLKKEMSGGGQRKCNSNLTITVGENKNCSSQGENACTLYVYAVDDSGIQGEMATVTYNIDWESPKVGKVSKQDSIFQAEVSDNVMVGYCWFYLNNKNVGSMKIENSSAVLEYPVPNQESYAVFVRCADQYDSERTGYLNLAVGESAEFTIPVNHPPTISFCRVSPTQGNIQTDFQFSAAASDSDGDSLSYNWDFGDGKSSDEKNPKHYYSVSGTFEPKVSASDTKGEKANCSTAWVVVSD